MQERGLRDRVKEEIERELRKKTDKGLRDRQRESGGRLRR